MLTEIKYKTFDELVDEVRIDLKTFDLEGNIDSQQLIKVASRINYELGIKINPSKSKIITIANNKGKLPFDFYVANFGLICDGKSECSVDGDLIDASNGLTNTINYKTKEFNTTIDLIIGSNIITHSLGTINVICTLLDSSGNTISLSPKIISDNKIDIISFNTYPNSKIKITAFIESVSNECRASLFSENGLYYVIGYSPFNTYRYNNLIRVKFKKTKSVVGDCLNLNFNSNLVVELNNGFIHTNFESGDLYLNYQSTMEDDEGNLLVLDHPLVNEYYEYAIKQRIYDNLFQAGEDVQRNMQLTDARLRLAKRDAISFARTPDFSEMRDTWELNRKAMRNKYFNMFKS